jgi:hypothetical protein
MVAHALFESSKAPSTGPAHQTFAQAAFESRPRRRCRRIWPQRCPDAFQINEPNYGERFPTDGRVLHDIPTSVDFDLSRTLMQDVIAFETQSLFLAIKTSERARRSCGCVASMAPRLGHFFHDEGSIFAGHALKNNASPEK